MSIPENFIDELIQKSDILDVVSKYVALKKSGSTYFGLCPFHNEKTPSFSVSPEKQLYHCFGCGAGGGIINFVMRAEGLDFIDSVRYLADLYGMQVPEMGSDFKEQKQKISRLYALNKAAARYFNANLRSEAGAEAHEYLLKRKLSENTITKFGLGFALNSWNGLCDAMRKAGFYDEELVTVGLAIKTEKGRIYDRFRNRVMFPIIDTRGEVLAFGGRVMDDSLPKYLNSPESVIFHKGKNLFALNLARKSTLRRLILAEGYMDVISLHQAGFSTAVASLGTSLTEEQAKLMTRYADEVVISYDGDDAGRKATLRAIEILKKTQMKIKVLSYTGAKDPDEYIKKNGTQAFSELIDGSQNDVEHKLSLIEKKYDLQTDEGRLSYLKEAITVIAALGSAVEREIYCGRCAAKSGISQLSVQNEVNRAIAANKKKNFKREQRELAEPAKNVQPVSKSMRYGNIRSAMAEEGVIVLCFHNNDFIDKFGERIRPPQFSSEFLASVYQKMIEMKSGGRVISADTLALNMNEEQASHLAAVLRKSPPADTGKAFADFCDTIRLESLKNNGEPADDNTNDDDLLNEIALYRQKKGHGGEAK